MNQRPASSAAWGPPRFVWIVVCVLLVIVVISAVSNPASTINRIAFPGGGEVTFEQRSQIVPTDKLQAANQQDVTTNQQKLQTDLSGVLQQQRLTSVPTSGVNLNGNWGGPNG